VHIFINSFSTGQSLPAEVYKCQLLQQACSVASLFMRLQKLFILFSFVLISSCEGIIRGKGTIISVSNNLPIDSVRINWFGKVLYSDENGNFSFDEFVNCVPSCPDLELVLTKKGYKTKYVNLTKEAKGNGAQKEAVIALTPTQDKMGELTNYKIKHLFFYVSIIIALVSLFTFIFILTDLKNKALWIPIILFGTIAIEYNYLANSFRFNLFRPAVFMYMRFTFEPTWYKLNLPLGLIVFWFYFLYLSKKTNKY
jgi:hypothetical protein